MKNSSKIIIFVFMLLQSPMDAKARGASEFFKLVSRGIQRETTQEASEVLLNAMKKELGPEFLDRVLGKLVQEGGEQLLDETAKLTAKHGTSILRALDNVDNPLDVLKMLKALPTEEVAGAASRLAAGESGRQLASLSSKLGLSVLRAEVKHPGLSLKLAQSLGKDWIDASLDMTTQQTILLSKYSDEIADLPDPLQSQVLDLCKKQSDAFFGFVGRFIERNPGTVLFTTVSATALVANSEQIFGRRGEGHTVDGIGSPEKSFGLIGYITHTFLEYLRLPLQTTLYGLGGILCACLSLPLIMRPAVNWYRTSRIRNAEDTTPSTPFDIKAERAIIRGDH